MYFFFKYANYVTKSMRSYLFYYRHIWIRCSTILVKLCSDFHFFYHFFFYKLHQIILLFTLLNIVTFFSYEGEHMYAYAAVYKKKSTLYSCTMNSGDLLLNYAFFKT